METDFETAVEQLESRGSDRKEPSLDSTVESLEALDRPDKDYRVVLVGGTNGKGSTVEMISEMLMHQGFKVGTYKSPHLVTCRERIKSNGQKIGEEEFLELYQEVEDLGKQLTFFEFMTVTAFLYFSREEVDYAVMEVGMGGRLDATNAAEPELAVITNIGNDHSRYLGETREKVAAEIAPILPENGIGVVGDRLEPVEQVAEERKVELFDPFRVKRRKGTYSFRGQEFQLPVKGSFQKQNLEVALKAVEALEGLPEEIGKSLEDLECPGRMEKVSSAPEIILDGAHNPGALEKIRADLPEKFVCVFNVLGTKDVEEMVSRLENQVSEFYLVESSFSLAEDSETIAEHLEDYSIFSSIPEAVESARNQEKPVVVTGSLYLVGDVKKYLEDQGLS